MHASKFSKTPFNESGRFLLSVFGRITARNSSWRDAATPDDINSEADRATDWCCGADEAFVKISRPRVLRLT
jgi:hypothetical protein